MNIPTWLELIRMEVREACLLRSAIYGGLQVCEACGGDHYTFECCQQCNVGGHECPGCGNSLGHLVVGCCEQRCIACGHARIDHSIDPDRGPKQCRECKSGICLGTEYESGASWLRRVGIRIGVN